MSFSLKVKEELCTINVSSRHCKCAELSAFVMLNGFDNKITTDKEQNDFAINRYAKMISSLNIDLASDEDQKTLKLIKLKDGYCINTILIERSCCKQAFIRGAFIASGSITDPQKGYHFEITCDNLEQVEVLMNILKDFGIEPRYILRKKYHVVYIKDASMIVDILNIMGAYISLMDMENVRILKEMRNSVNRKVNCEAANINKTVNAAVKQMEDIRYIESVKGLSYLPHNLRAVAELRMAEPEMPLKEIGNNLNPPLGKSGVNHRLRKISEIADELRRN
ncbi:MAG: DNA-binding protein WhiA [Lachnospiraceae bacterium]|nr:DNA-binding protein WhiA [Lachnospiraceae bacterium]